MNKKGFTLVEVMGVIVLLAAITLIALPVVDKQLKQGNEELYESTIDSIEGSLELYMSGIDLRENEYMKINLYQLKQTGLIDNDLKNPVTGEFLPNDMLITITNNNGALEYNIDLESGNNKRDYDSIPEMSMTNFVEYVELEDDYTVSDTDVTSKYNDTVLTTSIEGSVNTSTLGVYIIKYKTSYQNVSNEVYKTVIVRDTKGPIIEFDDLYLSLSSVHVYDYEEDINVFDPSGVKSIDVETDFGALTGLYSVKYTAIDNLGNKTVKYRKVITN